LLDGDEPVKIPAEESPMAHPIIAFIGVPYDGAATLGWPGARYAPAEVRRHLTWMLNRVQGGQIYWVDEDRIVPFDRGQLHDAGRSVRGASTFRHRSASSTRSALLSCRRARCAAAERSGRSPGSARSPAARITSSSVSTWMCSILHTRLASGGTSPAV